MFAPCAECRASGPCSSAAPTASVAAAGAAAHQAAPGGFAMLGSHIMPPQLLQQLLHSTTAPGLPQPAAILPFPQLYDLPDLPAPAPSEGMVARATLHSHQHSHAPHCQLGVRPAHTQLLPVCLHAQRPCQHMLPTWWITAHQATRLMHQACQQGACCAINYILALACIGISAKLQHHRACSGSCSHATCTKHCLRLPRR